MLDMGLARFREAGPLDGDATQSELTQLDAVLGTLGYMAPEQATAPHRVNHRVNVYALGCTLHFLLTGRAPFPAAGIAEALIAHRNAPIPSLRDARPEVPEALDALFRSLIAKRPEDRPASTAEVAEALDRIAAGDSSEPAPPPPSRRRRGRRRRGRGGRVARRPGAELCLLARPRRQRHARRRGDDSRTHRQSHRSDARARQSRPGRRGAAGAAPRARGAVGLRSLAVGDATSARPVDRQPRGQPGRPPARLLRRDRDRADR